jgi:hypothetical protein
MATTNPAAQPPSVTNPIDRVFSVNAETFDESTVLSNLGLIMFILISDWKGWVDRRVESVRFLDPDTARCKVSVDMTIPALPGILQHNDEPLRLMPLALLRKRRLVQFDLRDEAGRALPLLSSRSNGALAAATLTRAARAFTEREAEPMPAALLRDLWLVANEPAQPALRAWTRLAQADPDDPDDVAWRRALTGSWRFMALSNDLARNFMVVTPLECAPGDRRVIKFAYTEPARASPTRRPSLSGRRLAKIATVFREPRHGTSRRHTLTVEALVDSPKRRPLPGVLIQVNQGAVTETTGITGPDGRWAEQLEAGSHTLTISVPAGYIARHPPSRDGKLTITLTGDHSLRVPFLEVPRKEDSPAGQLSRSRRLREQAGLDPKTIDITAPAAGQARSYHLEYVVSEGMQATFASLSELPSAQPAEPPEPAGQGQSTPTDGSSIGQEARDPPDDAGAPADADATHGASVLPRSAPALSEADAAEQIVEQEDTNPSDAPPTPKTDYHRATEDRVHLYLSNVPQEYTAAATVKLRPRSSTIVRAGTLAAVLSLAMIGIITWRWEALGVSNIGSEIALLLAVPGGLSAYVALGHADRFTTIVLSGLRALAFTPTFWCLTAAVCVLISRTVHIDPDGKTHVGDPLDWTTTALIAVLALNTLTVLLIGTAYMRAAKPPESRQLEQPAAQPPDS